MRQGLQIEQVSRTFQSGSGRTVHALDRLTLDVPAGQIVAVVGPSGCGKSTLLDLVAGFDRPDGGQIRFDGQPVGALPAPDRCVVFQQPNLFGWLNVRQNVSYGLKRQGMGRQARRQAAMDMLAQVGLSGFERQYPAELSGGMQQRVALARALVMRPRILLMDEPFSALDAPLRAQMHALVRGLWSRLGPTILLVTHDIAEAVAVAHAVAVLTPRPGRVRQVISVPCPVEARADFLRTPACAALCAQIEQALGGQNDAIL